MADAAEPGSCTISTTRARPMKLSSKVVMISLVPRRTRNQAAMPAHAAPASAAASNVAARPTPAAGPRAGRHDSGGGDAAEAELSLAPTFTRPAR